MASVYTQRFGAVAQSAAGTSAIFTPPDSKTYVIVCIDCNTGASATTSTIVYISGAVGNLDLIRQPMAAGTHLQWTGRQVIELGETLNVQSVGGPMVVVVTGYALSP